MQIMPISVLATEIGGEVYVPITTSSSVTSTTTGAAINWYNYSVISTSTDPLEVSGSNILINGDVHSNGNFMFNGSTLDLLGKCETSSKIKANGWKINITSKFESSPILAVPDLVTVIKVFLQQ